MRAQDEEIAERQKISISQGRKGHDEVHILDGNMSKDKNIHCHGFCATCKYYERCLLDGEDGRKLREKKMENLKRKGKQYDAFSSFVIY